MELFVSSSIPSIRDSEYQGLQNMKWPRYENLGLWFLLNRAPVAAQVFIPVNTFVSTGIDAGMRLPDKDIANRELSCWEFRYPQKGRLADGRAALSSTSCFVLQLPWGSCTSFRSLFSDKPTITDLCKSFFLFLPPLCPRCIVILHIAEAIDVIRYCPPAESVL